MATNRRRVFGRKLRLTCTDPATPASGDPVLIGQLAGVALTNEDANGETVVDTQGVYAVSVKGIDGGGNVAVAAGDRIYYVTGDTPKLSKKATGVPFGFALEAVGSGLTATITVRLAPGV